MRFNDVRVPPENVLGEPGEGFHIAMQVLNNGRIGLGTGSVGLAKRLLDLAIAHVTTRRQFGKTLSEFDMVEEKIGWMVSYLFGLESLAYLTTGMIDAGIEDYSVESAIAKISGTEFVWYQANRALQLAGGLGYMRDQPYEQILRDIRIFPIFEGANDVMRSFVALSALKPLGEELEGLGDLGLGDPDRVDRRAGRVRVRPREARDPPGPCHARARGAVAAGRLASATRSSGCAARARGCCASTARASSTRASRTGATAMRSATSTRRSPCSRA